MARLSHAVYFTRNGWTGQNLFKQKLYLLVQFIQEKKKKDKKKLNTDLRFCMAASRLSGF